MRRAFLLALACVAIAPRPAAAGEARRTMADGVALFADKNFEGAARKFEEAAARAAGEGLDASVPRYNQASALVMGGKGPEAAAAFAEALRSSDPGLRVRAHYNRGVALVMAAETLQRAGDTDQAIQGLEQALEAYENAMRADPKDEDPKINHELAAREKARLEELRQGERPSGRGEEAGRQGAGVGQKTRQRPPETEMTADEARLMLGAIKQQEIARRGEVRPPRGAHEAVERDW